ENAIGPGAVEHELGQPAIRLLGRQEGVVDGLVILYSCEQAPAIAVVIEPDAAIEVRDAGDAQAAAQVLEVTAVGDFPEVDPVAPSVVEDGLVLHGGEMRSEEHTSELQSR